MYGVGKGATPLVFGGTGAALATTGFPLIGVAMIALTLAVLGLVLLRVALLRRTGAVA